MTDGLLEHPEPGVLPPVVPAQPYTREVSKWQATHDQVVVKPGIPHLVFRCCAEDPETSRSQYHNAAKSLRDFLESRYTLERWDIHKRTLPDTWYDRQIWMVFQGNMTPAEAVEYRRQRKADWTALRSRRGRENVLPIFGTSVNQP